MDASFTTLAVPDQLRPARSMVGDALRRPGGRRALSVLSIVLALAGVGMFSWPFLTDIYSQRRQATLRTQFDDPEFVEEYRAGKVAVGRGLTRLRIPTLGVDVLVVQGTTPSALRAGAGHYVETPLPGLAGNVSIAGHRTTYGRPFNQIDKMKTGDKVLLETPIAIYEYSVVPAFDGHANPWPTDPNDFSVVSPPANPAEKQLTLTTCHPKGSAKQRLILRLTLTKTMPRASGG